MGIARWECGEIDPQYSDTAEFCEQYGYGLPHSAYTVIGASKRWLRVVPCVPTSPQPC